MTTNLLAWLLLILQTGDLPKSESFEKAIVVANNSAKNAEIIVENPIELTLFPAYARHASSKLLLLCSRREDFSLHKLARIESRLYLSSNQGERFQLVAKAPNIEDLVSIESPANLRKSLGKPDYVGTGFIEDLDSKLIRRSSFCWKIGWFDKGQLCLLDVSMISKIEVVGARGVLREREADSIAQSEVDSPQEELLLLSLKSSNKKYADNFRSEGIHGK